MIGDINIGGSAGKSYGQMIAASQQQKRQSELEATAKTMEDLAKQSGIAEQARMAGRVAQGTERQYGIGKIAAATPQEFRNQQLDLARMLQARAAGTAGPSLAEMQLRRSMEQGSQALSSQLASTPGLNPAVAARLAGQTQAQNMADVAGRGAELRAQEQMQAEQALAQLAQGARGQDIGITGLEAGMVGQARQQQFGAEMALAEMAQQRLMGAAGQATQLEMARRQAEAQERGALWGVGGTLLGAAIGGPLGAGVGGAAGRAAGQGVSI